MDGEQQGNITEGGGCDTTSLTANVEGIKFFVISEWFPFV